MTIIKSIRKSPRRDIRKYFNEIASQWDSMRKEFYSVAVRDKLLSRIYPEPGNMIADLGAGTGFLSEGLINSPASVIAIDESKEMLKNMRIKFLYSENIDYRVGDANNLPVNDNIINYALANMYLHHVDDPQLAIAEIYRILVSGGKLLLTDLEEHKFKFLATEHHDRWLGFNHSDMTNWLREAGFINVSVYPIEEFCCAKSVKPEKEAKISIFLAEADKP